MQRVQKWLADKANQSVLFLLLGGLLFRSIVAFWLYPGFDEAYYYIYSVNLDWSYFDHPVLVALLTGLGPWLTGDVSQFTIRLGALLLYTGTLILLYLTSAKLFSAQAARITLAIATFAPIFQIAFGILILPDGPLMFFWTASLYCAAHEFFPNSKFKIQNSNLEQIKAKGRGQRAEGIYSDAAGTSSLSAQKEQEPQSPIEPSSVAPVQARFQSPFKRNLLPSAFCPLPSLETHSYQPTYRLAILGVLVGLACLGKYHGFVLGLGLLGFCLTSSRYRRVLLSPWAWLGVGLFIVTIFPIWYWNIQHNWVSFGFQLNRGVPGREFDLLKVGIVFLVGIAYLFPTFGFPLWWVSWRSLKAQIDQFFSKKPFIDQKKAEGRGQRAEGIYSDAEGTSHLAIDREQGFQAPYELRPQVRLQEGFEFLGKDNLLPSASCLLPFQPEDFLQKQLLILWVSLPLTVGFTLMGAYQQILPTWPMPGFWGLTLLLGQQAAIWEQQSRRWVRRWLNGSGIIISTALLLALLHVATGTLQTGSQYALLGGFWQPKDDPSTELIDIQQLRRGFAESPLLMKALRDSSFVFTNGYYLGGQIGMALIPLTHTPVTCFAPDMRGFAFWSKPDQWLGKDALYITLDRFHKKEGLTDRYRPYFNSLQEIGTVPIRRGGAQTELIHVYQAKTLLKPYPRPYGN